MTRSTQIIEIYTITNFVTHIINIRDLKLSRIVRNATPRELAQLTISIISVDCDRAVTHDLQVSGLYI